MTEQQASFKVLEQDLEGLNRLDAKALARRWRTLVGGTVPAGLGRALMLRVLAYHLQARRYGDLDQASRRLLNDILVRSAERTMEVGSDPRDCAGQNIMRAPQLRPGTVLSREYGGTLHRVMVLEQGFSWNATTYDSLSKVAFAITGTRWNGPRFFGLRDRGEATKTDRRRSVGDKVEGGKPVRSRVPAGSEAQLSRATPP